MLRKFFLLVLCALLGAGQLGWISTASAQEDIPYLLTAASKGDVVTVRAMLDSGTNPDTRDADGLTALMYAARKDKADVALALLEKARM